MEKLQSRKSLSDSAFLITLTTALLYAVGYLHEVPFLEKFGLKSDEFVPGNMMLLTYGFRYLFLKLTPYALFASFILVLIFYIFICFKKVIFAYIYKHIKNEELADVLSDLKIVMLFFFVFIASISSLKIISDGEKEFREYTTENKEVDIFFINKYKSGIVGRVIRYNNNKIAFYDIKSKIAIVIPDSELIELKYSVHDTTDQSPASATPNRHTRKQEKHG